MEKQLFCNKNDVHTLEPIVAKLFWNKRHCDLRRNGRLAKLVGTVPVNRFECRFKYSRSLKRPSSLGIVPFRMLCPRSIQSRLMSIPMDVGTVPLKPLSLRSNAIKLEGSMLMTGPMSPFSWLICKVITSRFRHWPSSVGIVPPNVVLSKMM